MGEGWYTCGELVTSHNRSSIENRDAVSWSWRAFVLLAVALTATQGKQQYDMIYILRDAFLSPGARVFFGHHDTDSRLT